MLFYYQYNYNNTSSSVSVRTIVFMEYLIKLLWYKVVIYAGEWTPNTMKSPRNLQIYDMSWFTGDGRVNEHIGLTAIHTMFHRYHNWMEEGLHHINPHWDGETLYQEARKIVGAIWQRIVYNEYLPLVLGPKEMKRHGLNLRNYGYYEGDGKECTHFKTIT